MRPDRAERKAIAQAAKRQAAATAYAEAEVPAAFDPGKSVGPDLTPGTGLQSAQERRLQQQEESRAAGRVKDNKLGHPVGRPTEYTDDEADTICAWVMEGGSLRAYCRTTGRAAKTVYQWMREDAQFAARYSRACEDRADSLTDDGLERVDAAAVNPTIEGVAAAKLQWEARKWLSSKLRPQKWGDKQMVEHVGAVNIRIGIPLKPGATAQLTHSSDDVIDV